MILYYAVTSYHVLCCMLHKMKWNRGKSAVLYLSDTHPEFETLKRCVSGGNIFDRVEAFPDRGRMQPFRKEYAGKESKTKLKALCEKFCQELEEDLPFSPSEIEEYNICGDQYGIGFWLIDRKISYNYFEEGCGVYTRSQLLLENLKRLNPFQYDAALFYGCIGQNDRIKHWFVDYSAQMDSFAPHKGMIDFSVKEILKELSEDEIKEILSVFQVSTETKHTNHAVLLLTQQFVNMGFLSISQQKELYDYMLDYYAGDGQVYIKPHPSDWQGMYEKWYPEAVVFQRFMPSELLPYTIDGAFETGITVSSTSIFGLKEYLKQIICFQAGFEDSYQQIHSYYVKEQLEKHLQENGLKVPEIYVGQLDRNWYCQMDDVVCVPIEIIDDQTGCVAMDYLYCLCKEAEVRKQIMEWEMHKMLKRSEKQIVVDEAYYKRKCLALEGMLQATNERLKMVLEEKNQKEA